MKLGRLAFIDHSFHIKTRSNQFFIDLLSRSYDVDIYYDRSWEGGPAVDIEALSDDYTNFVFFQVIYKPEQMETIRRKNIVYVPMYDQVRSKDRKYWTQYRDCKVLCFCRHLYKKLYRYGFAAAYFQYFPEPVQVRARYRDKPVVYFWQRTSRLGWTHVRRLIQPEQVEKVIINDTVDPGQEFAQPSDADIRLYNIEFISWQKDEQSYYEFLSGIDVMVAPRLQEGIGLSLLDAMSRGIVVVASDRPTMNEYISGASGYLFNIDRLRYIDLSDFREKSAQARRCAEEGRLRWEQSQAKIVSFIQGPKVRPSLLRRFFPI
jgi:glycosyltransferase involved in cell wall biosynthesis